MIVPQSKVINRWYPYAHAPLCLLVQIQMSTRLFSVEGSVVAQATRLYPKFRQSQLGQRVPPIASHWRLLPTVSFIGKVQK